MTGSQVLAGFDSDEDAATGRVRAVVGWEDAKVADPADDFAAIVTLAGPAAVESVLEAYANSRIERPDPICADGRGWPLSSRSSPTCSPR
ncbi:MAG: hypothetical protein IPI13_00405 [Actinomycetales bacterium]|uniref:Uncharacterized protein n=1 Tax=Candidatus Phosphoribacter hodrii TaxID=2953743 RepID=A0A935IHZ5_9MICO|nr:hypothetical protein [Candidatus Phosphoribacter hodrii]